MKTKTFVALFFLALQLNAQRAVQDGWFIPESKSSLVGFNVAGAAASAQLHNGFVYHLTMDDRLDRSKLDDQLSALGERSVMGGGDYEAGLKLRIPIGQSAHSALFKVSDAAHADVRIPSSAFHLAFYGNKPFAGDTVDVSGFEINLWRYQQVALGWAYRPKPGTEFYALVSILNGEQFSEARLDRAWLYTSTLGDTLSAGFLGSYYQSDTAHVGFARTNGGGAAVDLGFHREFEGRAERWSFDAQVNNLGVMQWRPTTMAFSTDSNIVFRGVDVGDIRTFNERTSQQEITDSLNSDFDQLSDHANLNRMVPGWFETRMCRQPERGWMAGAGLTLRWKAAFIPFSFATVGYRFGPRMALTSEWGYGGYAHASVSLSAAVNAGPIAVSLRIQNVESFLFPHRTAGGGAGLSCYYTF